MGHERARRFTRVATNCAQRTFEQSRNIHLTMKTDGRTTNTETHVTSQVSPLSKIPMKLSLFGSSSRIHNVMLRYSRYAVRRVCCGIRARGGGGGETVAPGWAGDANEGQAVAPRTEFYINEENEEVETSAKGRTALVRHVEQSEH